MTTGSIIVLLYIITFIGIHLDAVIRKDKESFSVAALGAFIATVVAYGAIKLIDSIVS